MKPGPGAAPHLFGLDTGALALSSSQPGAGAGTGAGATRFIGRKRAFKGVASQGSAAPSHSDAMRAMVGEARESSGEDGSRTDTPPYPSADGA